MEAVKFVQGEYLCGHCHLRSVSNWPPRCTFHPALIAFISDALQGSWFGVDTGQLDPITQLHPRVGKSGQFYTEGARKRYATARPEARKGLRLVTLGVADTGRHALVPITASRG